MTGKQILIVEDEKPIRDMIAFSLRRAGFDVREAEDCNEARARIADRGRTCCSSTGCCRTRADSN